MAKSMVEMKMELKLEPTIVIRLGESKIGYLTFDNVGVMGEFLTRLKESIEELVVEFKSAKTERPEDKQE